MQRHSSAVRELIHWRGEPDPFKGDVPNARVREFAKEVVEVLFNSTPVTNSTNTLAAQGKIQGFGSGGETSTSTYSGIGRSSSGHYSGTSSSSGVTWPHGLTGLAVAQQAASQITRSAQQALGEGPIAQGIANAANALGGLLQPQGYGSRLNVSFQVGVGQYLMCAASTTVLRTSSNISCALHLAAVDSAQITSSIIPIPCRNNALIGPQNS
eukprot:GHUV01029358.1.p1 GENE.GHUV01029358.1~~GHUV01029358.1.p1  ORF type:complete len:212 (+),score=36.59 GHUV01029358.1:432-1067(+)